MAESSDSERDSGPGIVLRRARERAGLSRDEVAEQLNLIVNQVEALEQDRFEALPGAAYVQGYLRAYARLLDLDSDALVAAYAARRPPAPPLQTKPSRRRPTLDYGAGQRHWGLVLLAAVLLGLWWWQQHEPAPPPELPQVEAGLEVAPTQAPEVVPVNPVASEAEGPTEQPAPDPTLESDPIGENPDRASTANGDRLTLRFSDDCWVEIRDGRGDVLVAELKRADEVLEVEGRGPFKVLLGFAPAVDMAFNGQPVAVQASGGNQTATLVVGSS